MIVLGFKTMKIERLLLSGDFRARLDSARIFERARSIQRLGILSEPMVRESDGRVIYGHDRIAAAIRCGWTEIKCKLVDCNDEELHEIELTENVHRRHNPEAQREGLLRVVEMYEEQIAQDPNPSPLIGPQVKRARTARGLARARVAAEHGVKPESIRRYELRAKKARRKKTGQIEKGAEFNKLGMDVHQRFVDDVGKIDRHLGSAMRHLELAQAALTAIRTQELPMSKQRLDRLYDTVHGSSMEARGLRPVSLCPFCKGLPGIQENCAACMQSGWIGTAQAKHVPGPLWSEGDGAVFARNGKYESVAKYIRESSTDTPPAEQVINETLSSKDLFP